MINKIKAEIENCKNACDLDIINYDLCAGEKIAYEQCLKWAEEEKAQHENQVKAIIDVHKQELREIKKGFNKISEKIITNTGLGMLGERKPLSIEEILNYLKEFKEKQFHGDKK